METPLERMEFQGIETDMRWIIILQYLLAKILVNIYIISITISVGFFRFKTKRDTMILVIEI